MFQILITALICAGLWILLQDIFLRLRCSKTTEARIVDIYIRTEIFGRGHSIIKYYYPVYEYEVDGRIYQGKPHQCSKLENWFQIGDTALINYNPHDPGNMTVRKNISSLFAGILFVVTGIILLLYCKLHQSF